MKSLLAKPYEVEGMKEDRISAFVRPVKHVFTPDTILVKQIHPFENVFMPYDKWERFTSSGIKAPYQSGDIIAVKEGMYSTALGGAMYTAGGKVTLGQTLEENEYLDWDDFCTTANSISSALMPRRAVRIYLQVQSISVKRIQDIDNTDAINLGMMMYSHDWVLENFPQYAKRYHAWEPERHGNKPPVGPQPAERFKAHFQSIYGIEAWEANPWHWMVRFNKIQKP